MSSTPRYDLRIEYSATWGGLRSGKAADAPEGTFTAVTTGKWHSCGLRTDATITCWGWNAYGQTDAPSGTFTAITTAEL
ncbi:MAG: hypothetical protein F4232_11095, partial [Acidimicrobiaceae bacterium]|nr:hypothetical protein [Acidimicrobiaceae bacterium]